MSSTGIDTIAEQSYQTFVRLLHKKKVPRVGQDANANTKITLRLSQCTKRGSGECLLSDPQYTEKQMCSCSEESVFNVIFFL